MTVSIDSSCNRRSFLATGLASLALPRLLSAQEPTEEVDFAEAKVISCEKSVQAIAISPDGKNGVVGLSDKSIHLYELATGRQLLELKGHTETVSSVSISLDGKVIGSTDVGGDLMLWDATNGKLIRTVSAHTGIASRVVFSPTREEEVCATGGQDSLVKLWNRKSGELIRELNGHTRAVTSVAFSPDGKLVASTSVDSTVRMWDTSDGTARYRIILPDIPNALAFSPDGERFAVGGRGFVGSANLDGSEFKGSSLIKNNVSAFVKSVTFTGESSVVVTALNSTAPMLWYPNRPERVVGIQGHTRPTTGAAYSENVLLTGSLDRTLRIWSKK